MSKSFKLVLRFLGVICLLSAAAHVYALFALDGDFRNVFALLLSNATAVFCIWAAKLS